jgi:precorrin-8X/cobalt-precorrin-8 methylmutase
MFNYIKNPAQIYARSFEIIRSETDLSSIPKDAHEIAVRIIHACGMPEIISELEITQTFAMAARSALAAKRPIIVDVEMVRHGIIARQLPQGVEIICTLNDPRAREIGITQSITRTAASTQLWKDTLEGAIVVIGNAPTALFALLEMIDAGSAKPACIIGMPVGFVGAVESKDELIANSRDVPFATIKGRKGGSAVASSVVNALTSDMQ